MKEVGIDPFSGIAPVICILGKGLWKIGMKANGKTRTWQKLDSK